MSDFPLYHSSLIQVAGIDSANSRGTTVLSGASSHTKGSWTQIASSIPENCIGFWLHAMCPQSYRYLMDMAVGAAPTVVLENLYWNSRPYIASNNLFWPLALPAGEALYARTQAHSAEVYVQVSVHFLCAAFPGARPLGVATTYGANTGDTSGTLVDPGGTAHTKGSWTQIASSTDRDIRAIAIMFGNGAHVFPAVYFAQHWLVDVAVGAVSSEQIIIPDLNINGDPTSDSINNAVFGPIEMQIPAGTRIAARAQGASTDSTYRTIRMIVIGMS